MIAAPEDKPASARTGRWVRLSIRDKMIAIIGLPTLAIYVVVLGAVLARLAASNEKDVKRTMTDWAVSSAARFDAAFERAAAICRTTANMMESAPDLTEPQIYAQLKANVLQDDAVYGAAMAFEPGTFKTDDSLY